MVVGSFDQKFLALPDEVLITSMREHQRYFSLRGKDGKLLPHFIAVNNTLTRNPDVVRQGHQRVLRARLSDAMYFFQVDSKVPLENRVEALKGVMFHSLLGSSYEKMERFRELAAGLARQLAPQLEDKVRRAATLAKADITTEMVGEFPSLQGVMGEKYSLLTGEDPEVATALFSHYLPRHADDILPGRPGGGPGGPGRPAGHHLRLLRRGPEPHRHRRPLRSAPPRPGHHPHPARPSSCIWTCRRSSRRAWSCSRPKSAAPRKRPPWKCWTSSKPGCNTCCWRKASARRPWPRSWRPAAAIWWMRWTRSRPWKRFAKARISPPWRWPSSG